MKPVCSEYLTKIARLLLEDLPADEQQALEAHLAACPQCQSEKESYARTLGLMQSMNNDPVPRHFFVQSEDRALNPWDLFRMLKPKWQAVTVAVAGLFLLASVGGVLGFSRRSVDIAELKKEFLKAAEEQNRRSTETLLQNVRTEIARSGAELTQQQKAELIAALNRIDGRMTGRLRLAEERVRNDAQKMAVNVYRAVSQQRAQDLSLINLRFDGIEAKNDMENRQNDTILSTLLQVAELGLK